VAVVAVFVLGADLRPWSEEKRVDPEIVELPPIFRDETRIGPPPAEAAAERDSGMPREDEPAHGSFSGFFHLHGSSRAWKEGVWDGYLTTPAVLLPAGLTVAAVVVYHWDRRLEAHWQGLIGGNQEWSNIGVYTLIGSAVITGLLLPGEGRNGWDETWTVAEAFLASYLTTTVLKSSVSRLRPGHGTHSFPSGHSAMAFTGATLMESNLGPVGGLPAYGLAAFTAFERVESGRHYPSDVLAGAAIGTLSAGIIDALHWGGSGNAGITTPPVACDVDVQGLRAFSLQVSIRF